MTDYDADYFERGKQTGKSLYKDYRWLPELTIPYCHRFLEYVNVSRHDSILDFGCAKGYYVKAMRLLGYDRVFGCDISDYAIESEDSQHLIHMPSPTEVPIGEWDWIHAKDVLEHCTEEELVEILKKFRQVSTNVFIIVPLGDGDKYAIPSMEEDATHRIRRPLGWWWEQLVRAGYKDSTGSYWVPGLKERWKNWPEGNGFLIGR